MFYHPDIIMYLWFFPFAVWVILPMFLGGIGLSLRLINQVLFIDNDQALAVKKRDRRQGSRFNIAQLAVQVSDGHRSAPATISNVSHCGLCLQSLPEKILQTAEKLTITFQEQGAGLHTLLVQPVWVEAASTGLRIGSTVHEPTPQWREFVRNYK